MAGRSGWNPGTRGMRATGIDDEAPAGSGRTTGSPMILQSQPAVNDAAGALSGWRLAGATHRSGRRGPSLRCARHRGGCCGAPGADRAGRRRHPRRPPPGRGGNRRCAADGCGCGPRRSRDDHLPLGAGRGCPDGRRPADARDAGAAPRGGEREASTRSRPATGAVAEDAARHGAGCPRGVAAPSRSTSAGCAGSSSRAPMSSARARPTRRSSCWRRSPTASACGK